MRVAFGEHYKVINAATTLPAQLAVGVENVDLLRSISTAKATQLATTKSRNAFTAMVARIAKLTTINADKASDLKQQFDKLNEALNGSVGVLALAKQQLRRTNEIQSLPAELTAMINIASDKLNESMILVESKEKNQALGLQRRQQVLNTRIST
jgi:hypothetical protein